MLPNRPVRPILTAPGVHDPGMRRSLIPANPTLPLLQPHDGRAPRFRAPPARSSPVSPAKYGPPPPDTAVPLPPPTFPPLHDSPASQRAPPIPEEDAEHLTTPICSPDVSESSAASDRPVLDAQEGCSAADMAHISSGDCDRVPHPFDLTPEWQPARTRAPRSGLLRARTLIYEMSSVPSGPSSFVMLGHVAIAITLYPQ